MSEPACSSCGWDAEGCRSGNNPGTWRCDHQELSLIPFSHPWGEESSRSPSTQYWGLSLGTATPRLPLDLVPAFLSINPLGPCMKPCLTSTPQFTSLSGSVLQTPFLPLCFLPAFFPHPCLLFPLGSSCVQLDPLLPARPGQCWDEALQVQESSWRAGFLQARKMCFPQQQSA